MTVPSAIVSPADAVSAIPQPPDSSFEARWQAWKAQGIARDRVSSRRLRIAAAVALPLGLVGLALFLMRQV